MLASRALYNLPRGDVRRHLSNVLAIEGLTVPQPRTFGRALDFWVQHNVDCIDALCVAQMERLKIGRIASFDGDFDRIPGIDRLELWTPAASRTGRVRGDSAAPHQLRSIAMPEPPGVRPARSRPAASVNPSPATRSAGGAPSASHRWAHRRESNLAHRHRLRPRLMATMPLKHVGAPPAGRARAGRGIQSSRAVAWRPDTAAPPLHRRVPACA